MPDAAPFEYEFPDLGELPVYREGCTCRACSLVSSELKEKESMSAVTAIGSGILTVPVLVKPPKKEVTIANKKAKREKKRKIMRDRAANYKAFLLTANEDWGRRMGLWCARRPHVNACYANSGRLVEGAAETLRSTYDGLLYVEPTRVLLRRQVSAGETEEQFYQRIEGTVYDRWRAGYSYVDQACNCPGCMSYRKQYFSFISLGRNRPETYALMHITEWDAEYNPYASNYRYRTTPRRSDTAARHRRPQGAGSSGEMFTDKAAKGGAARLIGVEVECNRNVNLDTWLDAWRGAQVITDGSCGYEAVTPPVAGKNVKECLSQLMSELNMKKAGCDSRCGLHIHVDARDMRWQDMLRFLTVYCRLEPLLFLIGGQNRYRNEGGYCKPVAKLYEKALRQTDPKGAILAAAVLSDSDQYLASPTEGRDSMRNNPGKKGGGRYKAINIMPWVAGRAYQRSDVTVEFRLHRGSHNAERVIQWAYICQDIVDWCIKATNDDVQKLPKSAARALCHISPRCRGWIIRRLLGWRRSTTAGPVPLEDDVGNVRPRRIVKVRGGFYTVEVR